MALVLADRVKETSVTTGTGTFTLAGAVIGYQTFSAAIGNTNTCYYTIASQLLNEWEVGIGTVGAGTLTRTTILSSSNAGSAVTFSAGTKDVFVTYPAEKAVYLDSSNAYIPASPVFNGNAIISDNSANAALRITQVGAGNALLVEDSANPDSTPTVIDATGKVVVGHTATVSMPTGDGGLYGAGLEVLGVGGVSSSLGAAIYNNAAAGFGGALSLAKSNSATVGAHALVSSGDLLGAIYFSGSDGTNFIRSAQILSQVDGTPGTNDMPGRLVFSVTADGASSPTERMRIANNGSVFLGGNTANTNFSLTVGKNITGGTNALGVISNGQLQTDVTGIAQYFSASLSQITGVTTSQARLYSAAQGTISGTVTSQFGFYADATLIGATNNYGFYSNIATATTRSITFVERTTNIVTITTSVAHGFTAGQSVTVAAVTNTSVNGTFVIASVPTTTTFTYAQAGTDIVLVADTGTAAVGGRHNFYANGSAPNYFAGAVGIGTATPSATLEVVTTGSTIFARGSATTSSALVGAVASDYYSTPSFRGTYLQQNSSAATGTTLGFANANLGYLAFQNVATQALIYTNNASAIVFGTSSIDRGRVSSAGVWSLGAAAGSESLRVTPVASAVNYLNVQGAIAGQSPNIQAAGSDTNIAFAYFTKGAGQHFFYSNSTPQFNIGNTASAVNYLQASGNATTGAPILSAQGSDTNVSILLLSKGAGGHVFSTNTTPNIQFAVSNTASAVNYLQVTGAVTSGLPIISAQGSDANISLAYTTKGVSAHYFYTRNLTSLGFAISDVGSAVNYLQASGNVAGSAPTFTAVGSDTNIGISYTSKGTGGHVFWTNGATTQQFAIANTASAVNLMQVTGAATAGSPSITAQGSDTNIGLNFSSKGTGNIVFYANSLASVQFAIGYTTSTVNYLRVDGGATGSAAALVAAGSDTNINIALTPKGAGLLTLGDSTLPAGSATIVGALFSSNSTTGNLLALRKSADATGGPNFAQFKSRGTAAAPTVVLDGDTVSTNSWLAYDGTNYLTAASLFVSVDGAVSAGVMPGRMIFSTNNGTSNAERGRVDSAGNWTLAGAPGANSLRVAVVASAVNYVDVQGAATGVSPVIQAAGSDTNIDLALTPKGTGVLKFGTYTAGIIAQAGYITIKDAGGTTRRLLVG